MQTIISQWTADNLPAEYVQLVLGKFGFMPFDIPTELVLRKPEFVIPLQGRKWFTQKVFDGKKMIDYDWNDRKQKGMPCVYLVERWVNEGYDGHTEYRQNGYILTTDPDEVIKEMLR